MSKETRKNKKKNSMYIMNFKILKALMAEFGTEKDTAGYKVTG